MSKPPSNEFINWCKNPPEHLNDYSSREIRRVNGNNDVLWPQIFFNGIQGLDNSHQILCDCSTNRPPLLDIDGVTIGAIKITADIYEGLVIKNSTFCEVYIGGQKNDIEVILENCEIGKLTFKDDANGPREIILNILNTKIGTLAISQETIKNLTMNDGCILNIDCPPPSATNPFTGSVQLENVFLPLDKNKYLIRGAQPYRNMRSHLRNLENLQMANLFHSAELAIERIDDNDTNKTLSWTYEKLSDYGASAGKPLVYLFILTYLSFLIFMGSHGSTLTHKVDLVESVDNVERVDKYVGWQKYLTLNGRSGNAYRAAYLATQPIINPLGVFGSKYTLVVAKTGKLALWSGIQGLLSAILITLFIFAIRRRFKIKQ